MEKRSLTLLYSIISGREKEIKDRKYDKLDRVNKIEDNGKVVPGALLSTKPCTCMRKWRYGSSH
jgi:hypothetical protein